MTPEPTSSDACAKLIAHAVELGIAERPPEHKLTGDERAAIETQLRGELGARCSQLTRRELECAMAAQTLAALQACAG